MVDNMENRKKVMIEQQCITVSDSPPPEMSNEQMNGRFPEVVTEVEIQRKIQDILVKLKVTDKLESEEYYQDFRYLWQMCRYSSNNSLRKAVVHTFLFGDFLSIFIKLWHLQETNHCFNANNLPLWNNFRSAISVLWNACDESSAICQQFAKSLLMEKFFLSLQIYSKLPDFLENEKKVYFVKAMLGILHNIASNYEEAKNEMRTLNGVEILCSYLNIDHHMIKTKALITLSHIVDEDENEVISAASDIIYFILVVLQNSLSSPGQFSTKYGMGAVEIAEGVNNIALNDGNKIKIVENGAVPILFEMLNQNRNCQYCGIMVLWTLAFNPVNRKVISTQPGCLRVLNNLVNSKDKTLSHAARGALWEINNNDTDNLVEEAECPHVMISYQWDAQPISLLIKERLKTAGYKVWMDIENMTLK